MATNYATISQANLNTPDPDKSPYGAGDPYYQQSQGYIQPYPRKKGLSKWVKIGVPVAIIIIVGVVVGVVMATRNNSDDDKSSSSNSKPGSDSKPADPEDAATAKLEIGRFAVATNSAFMVPIYPTAVRAVGYTAFRVS